MNTSLAGRLSVFASRLPPTAALLVILGLPLAPSALFASGLAAVDLGSYYQAQPVQVASLEKPWILPLDLQSVSNAMLVTGRLGLDANARAAIERNGFVVVPFGTATNMVEVYASLRKSGIPTFVTSDSMLHLYHVQFDDILKSVETNQFFPRLATMSTALLQESLRQQSLPGDLGTAATRNAAFLAVAARLLGQTVATPPQVTALADQELSLIAAHSGFQSSPILKYNEDYSQYVPRGHYTRSESLKKYFKAMMWYGRMSFLLKGSDNPGPSGAALISVQDARIQTLQAVLLAMALDRLQGQVLTVADTWNRVYAVTAFFVGLADDLTPYEYNDAIVRLFGSDVQPQQFLDDAALFTLKRELASLRAPEIYGGTGNCEVPPDATPEDLDRVLDKTKGMRVMGQRFIPDSYMFQQLVPPVVGPFTGEGKPFTMEFTMGGPRRCFPRGLDVMAVLGSRLALNILDREGDTAYTGYDRSFNELARQFNSFELRAWNRNLYWAWLYSLRPLLAPCDSTYPPFMQTRAWQAKQLNTALASWTELRHDTILYAKQSYTPIVTSVPPEPDAGYAEPVPEFYQRLLGLARMTRVGLDNLHVLNSVQRTRLLVLEDLLAKLRDIAVAELELTPLTSAQLGFLAKFDEQLEPLTNGIPDGLDSGTVLVADVHTDGNTGQVLEEGVGYANVIVVAVPHPQGGLTFSAGPVMSYYEFKWPMANRLTDEAWSELLAGNNRPAPPAWTKAFAQPVTLPPEDCDGDRLADDWEQTYWAGTNIVNSHTADSDGDGMPNDLEALAGTNPADPDSCLSFRAGLDGHGGVNLTWQSVAGRTYRVRCSENLTDWRLLGTPVSTASGTAVVSDSTTNTASRFYLLEIAPVAP